MFHFHFRSLLISLTWSFSFTLLYFQLLRQDHVDHHAYTIHPIVLSCISTQSHSTSIYSPSSRQQQQHTSPKGNKRQDQGDQFDCTMCIVWGTQLDLLQPIFFIASHPTLHFPLQSKFHLVSPSLPTTFFFFHCKHTIYIHREWINVQSQRKKRKKPSYTSPLHFHSWSSIFLGLFPWLLFSSFPFFPCLMWTNVRLKWAKWSVSFPIPICEYTVTTTCPTFWKFAKLFFWCHYTLSWYGKMALYTYIHI